MAANNKKSKRLIKMNKNQSSKTTTSKYTKTSHSLNKECPNQATLKEFNKQSSKNHKNNRSIKITNPNNNKT